MLKGKLTREQAIEAAGEAKVIEVEAENCDYTNRLMPAGFEDTVEFSASVYFVDKDGVDRCLTAYYYQDAEDLKDCDDLSNLDWEINGYEID